MSQPEYASIFKCTPWLTKFLNRRGLKASDNRPLYEYHATSDEYGDLKRLLVDIGAAERLRKDKGYAACFTLFCSEWYRRDYDRDCGWSWEPVYKIIGATLSASELRIIVPKGLEGYWGRPVRFYDSDRRNFLGSLFSEGGLPFRLLKAANSRFQSVFSRILKQYDQFLVQGYSTPQLVQAMVEKSGLPQVFSEDTSIELISRMAEQLISLVQLYELDNKSEPVKELDSIHPKWRDGFPVPLDDETGSNLLNGLLQTASVETRTRQHRDKRSSCLHLWSEQQPDVLSAYITLPAEVAFQLTAEPSTTRFELAIHEGGNEVACFGAAYASLERDYAKVRLRKFDARFHRNQPSASLSLVAKAGGLEVGSILLEESAVAVGDVPLAFIRNGEDWLLGGQASCDIRDDEVLIILPEEGNVVSEHALSALAHRAFGMSVLVAHGQRDIFIDGNERYRIRTGMTEASHSGIELKGERLCWVCNPELTFLGTPRPYRRLSEIQTLQIKGFLNGKSIDECTAHETMGSQYFSVRNEHNETLLRRRVGILPADFQIEVKSGNEGNEGRLVILTRHPCWCALKEKTLEVHRKRLDNGFEIDLRAEGLPPANVHLLVTPNLESNPVEITLPFPTSGCLVFDCNNQQIAKNITTDDLLGARAYLFGRNGEPTRFTLELRHRSHIGHQAWYEWRYNTGERPLELSLYNLRVQIENLLSVDNGIDQVVDMRIGGGGFNSTWHIRRYKYSLHYDPDRQLLLYGIGNNHNRQSPEPVIMLVSEPERKPVALASRLSEGVATGEFELSSIIDKNGPWLVLPKAGEATSFRPYFIRGEPQMVLDVGEIHSLQKATQLFNPRAEVNTIVVVLDQMASDPAHSGWQFLRNLYDQYGYLPLATFEVWRALIQHPKALAMSLFKFEMSVGYLSRIENEFPVFWEFLPVIEIRSAADLFKTFLRTKGALDENLSGLLNKMYQQLGIVFPTYADDVQRWLSNGALPRQIPQPVMNEIIHDWYQELLREHSDIDESDWPKHGRTRLFHWIQSQKDPVIEVSAGTDFRYSVAWLPVFAAAVASGKATFDSVFGNELGAVFFLRQVRDFDSRWFNAIFQYCLLRNVAEK